MIYCHLVKCYHWGCIPVNYILLYILTKIVQLEVNTTLSIKWVCLEKILSQIVKQFFLNNYQAKSMCIVIQQGTQGCLPRIQAGAWNSDSCPTQPPPPPSPSWIQLDKYSTCIFFSHSLCNLKRKCCDLSQKNYQPVWHENARIRIFDTEIGSDFDKRLRTEMILYSMKKLF